eukprot:gene2156-17746_t
MIRLSVVYDELIPNTLAPTAKQGGFSDLMPGFCHKNDYPHIPNYHCIIHQSVHCAKLGDQYKECMTTIMKLVNYFRAALSLRHRQLRGFLQIVDTEFDDLLLLDTVRWLSQGKVLARFWQMHTALKQFLELDPSTKAAEFSPFLINPEKNANRCILSGYYKASEPSQSQSRRDESYHLQLDV